MWFYAGTVYKFEHKGAVTQQLEEAAGGYHTVPGTDSRGWVEEVFSGTERLCHCHINTTLHPDVLHYVSQSAKGSV